MRNRSRDISSFDMLLDTMCNTFGGVCFIALLITIISANLPKSSANEETPADVRTIEQNQRLNALMRKKEELTAALKVQADLNKKQEANPSLLARDVSDLRSSNADASSRLGTAEQEHAQLMQEIAVIGADIKVNEDEHARLSEIAAELQKTNQDLIEETTQVARAPMKHSTSRVPLHLIFKNGRAEVYRWPDTGNNYNDFNIVEGAEGVLVRPKTSFGVAINTAFERSGLLDRILLHTQKSWFVNLITDSASFSEVCIVRDILIRKGVAYNWHSYEGDVIPFVSASSFDTQ